MNSKLKSLIAPIAILVLGFALVQFLAYSDAKFWPMVQFLFVIESMGYLGALVYFLFYKKERAGREEREVRI